MKNRIRTVPSLVALAAAVAVGAALSVGQSTAFQVHADAGWQNPKPLPGMAVTDAPSDAGWQ